MVDGIRNNYQTNLNITSRVNKNVQYNHINSLYLMAKPDTFSFSGLNNNADLPQKSILSFRGNLLKQDGFDSLRKSAKTGINNLNKMGEKTAKQLRFERAFDFSKKYVSEHILELDKLLLNSEGKIECSFDGKSIFYSLDEILKPYKGNVDYFYHGTSIKNKNLIIKEGFKQNIAPKHGNLDGVGGTYFSLTPDNEYGITIKAKYNGKIAEVDTDLLDNAKNENIMKIIRHLKEEGMTIDEAVDYCEAVMREYLQRKIFEKGYQGIIGSNSSLHAGMKYFAALDPKLIQIVE